MGTLYYGTSGEPIEIADRLLTHLKVVLTAKLRRNEAFTLSWKHAAGEVAGRSTIWLQPSIPLRFVFDSAVADQLDRGLLHRLASEANSNAGVSLDLTDDTAYAAPAEPPAEVAPADLAPAEAIARTRTSRLRVPALSGAA
jgi:hypothetical protein